MKKAILGTVLTGLLLYGCSKEAKKINGSNPGEDVTPPKVEITAPRDGETFYLNPYCCGTPRVFVALQYIVKDDESLIESVYVNGEKQNSDDLATEEYEGHKGYEYTAERQIQYTVQAYDHAGNMGRSSVRIVVRWSE